MQSTHLSKLIQVLQRFNELQFKKLREFIHSPYFHVPSSSISLFDYLVTLYPKFPPNKLRPEVIARKGRKLPTSIKQSKAGTDILKGIDEFIAIEDWKKDKNNVTVNLLRGYKEYKLHPQFNELYQRSLDNLTHCPEQDIETFFHRHLFTEIKFNGADACLIRNSHNTIEPVINTFDVYFALKKLRYFCEVLNRKQVLGIPNHVKHIPIVLDILEPYTNNQYPYVYLFVNVYKMLEAQTFKESQRHYLIIRQFISEYKDKELLQGIKESVCYAINHCLYWLNRGYEEANEDYLWWIEFKINHGLLVERGILMPITFRNIVISAVGKKDSEWLNNFINVYSSYLPQEYSETSIAFSKGIQFYIAKKHKEAIRYFMTARAREEPVFNCVIRKWEWICLYESDPTDIDTLYNHLSSFEKYLQRHNEDLHQLESMFKNFIAYAIKLLQVNTNESLNIVIHMLQEEPYFTGKPWLLKQYVDRKVNKKVQEAGFALA